MYQGYPQGHSFLLDKFQMATVTPPDMVDGHIVFIWTSVFSAAKWSCFVIDYILVFLRLTDKPETCASTSSSVLARYFQRKALPLVGGAPCSQNQGYCDKFQVCRLLDADGPIARLKNSVLHLDDFEDLGEWMKVKVTCNQTLTTTEGWSLSNKQIMGGYREREKWKHSCRLQAHWWAILLAILALSSVMGCTICLCSRSLDTADI